MVLGGRTCEVAQEMRGLCKEMLKIYNGRGTVPATVARRLRVSGEEVDVINLKEEKQEYYNAVSTVRILSYPEAEIGTEKNRRSAQKCVKWGLLHALYDAEPHSDHSHL